MSVRGKVCFNTPKVKITGEGQTVKLIFSSVPLLHLSMDFKLTAHLFSLTITSVM